MLRPGYDSTLTCFFTVARPSPEDSSHGELHFNDPLSAVLVLQPGSRLVCAIRAQRSSSKTVT
jgi:hypothetical protein